MTSANSFARRRNRDATIDSICTMCYQTIASAHSEGVLLVVEQAHLCDPNGEYNLHRGDFHQLADGNLAGLTGIPVQSQSRAGFSRMRSKQAAA